MGRLSRILFVENCYWDGKYYITRGVSSLAETREFPNLNLMFINGVGNCIYHDAVEEKIDCSLSCDNNDWISKYDIMKNYVALFIASQYD